MGNRNILLGLLILSVLIVAISCSRPKGRAGSQNAEEFKPKVSRRGQNGNGTEKWAYVDVRPQTHMFYWLYYTYHPEGAANRPWILWLQGGPGASSCGYGNFELLGPLDLNLEYRNTTWVNEASVLFVDNPVGAGYSYVDDFSALTTNVEEITEDLLVVLRAVLEESPEFKTRPFYVFGQSYGGKMGAHFARRLYDEIALGTIEVQLEGFAMGNSWISPIDSTLSWAGLLYWMSLTDAEGARLIKEEADKSQAAIDNGNWVLATHYWGTTEGVVINQTNGVDFYNILKFEDYSARVRDVQEFKIGLKGHISDELYSKLFLPSGGSKAVDPLDELMNGPVIRAKLGIIPDEVIWGAQSGPVFTYQEGDFMKPVVSVVDSALKDTTLQTIVYSGQLDLICDTKATMDWVKQLTWEGLGNYNGARREAFERASDRQTEMYVKAHDRFKFYWVLGGGHAIAKDNGETALRMFKRIIENTDV